jgi:hypothetical protein
VKKLVPVRTKSGFWSGRTCGRWDGDTTRGSVGFGNTGHLLKRTLIPKQLCETGKKIDRLPSRVGEQKAYKDEVTY